MRRFLALFVSAAFLSGSLFAAPQKKTYPLNCDEVWTAVKKTTVPPHYNFAMMDDTQKKGIFSTGSALSGQRNLNIAVTGSGDTCTVAVGGAFSGIQNNDKGDLFKRLEKELETSHPGVIRKK